MRELYKAKVKELGKSDCFELFFWGKSKQDAERLALDVCTKDKLEMLYIEFIFAVDEMPEPVIKLGLHSSAEGAYSLASAKIAISEKIN